MIYTITVNPCLDILRFLEAKPDQSSLPEGSHRLNNPNTDEMPRPGGKGIDVSRALYCLGVESKALGFIGDQTGNIVAGLLKSEGISPDFIDIGVETRTNVIVVLRVKDEKDPQQTKWKTVGEIRINSPGKEVHPNKYPILYDRAAKINDAAALAICGSLSYNMQATFYNYLIAEIRANNPQCIVLLDSSADDKAPQPTVETMSFRSSRPSFIKPNLKEFRALLKGLRLPGGTLCEKDPSNVGVEPYLEYIYTGACIDAISEPLRIKPKSLQANWSTMLEFVTEIWKKYGVATVLSLGPMGCVAPFGSSGGIYHVYLPKRLTVLTRVGAGDCMVAGFLSSYVKDKNLLDALKWGVAAACARVCVEEYQAPKYLDADKCREYFEKLNVDEYPFESDYATAKFLRLVEPSMLAPEFRPSSGTPPANGTTGPAR